MIKRKPFDRVSTRWFTLTVTLGALCAAVVAGCARPAFQDDFAPGWEARQTAWRVATWEQNGAQMDPKRCRTDGQGHMIQIVEAGEPYLGGSMQTADEYGYGRWVARVKPSSVPGALNSVFTKDWDNQKTPESSSDGTKFEVDIEFLTYTFKPGGGQVHVGIHHEDLKPSFGDDVDLDFNPSDDFHEWGFDILPNAVVWHVDGREFYRIEQPWKVPFNADYEFFFNSWTRDRWIKGPPAEQAVYKIDWVKFYPMEMLDKLPPIKAPAKAAAAK